MLRNTSHGRNSAALWALLIIGCAIFVAAQPCFAAPVIKDTDRIVFVGDSITGQGGNLGASGWVQLIGEALKAAHPSAAQVLVPLGGSGQTVGSWSSVEKKSETASATLDVKSFDVKAELDKPADVIVIMLGMNDVLSPSLRDTQTDLDKWYATYDAFIQALRARTHPRVVALATVTPCTEDPLSPKNKVIDELNERVALLAKADDCVVLPTNKTDWDVLGEGRTYSPGYRITVDTVHPSGGGHLAIAMGMLDGLGEPAAAQFLRDGHLKQDFATAGGPLPTISYSLTSAPTASNPDARDMVVHYWWHSAPGVAGIPTVKLDVPDGFTLSAKEATAAHGEFKVSGVCDRLVTTITLTGTDGSVTRSVPIALPAAWLAGATPPGQPGWTIRNPWTFDPVAGALPVDTDLSSGVGFANDNIVVSGAPIHWVKFIPSSAYVGGVDPNSVDFGGVSFFGNFSDGYGARWIYSSKDRPIQLAFSSSGWGGSDHLQVWVNGESVYAGHFGRVPPAQAGAPAAFKTGWNALVFKSAHLQWLWQVSIAVQGVGGDTLDDLRYSAKPHPVIPAASK